MSRASMGFVQCFEGGEGRALQRNCADEYLIQVGGSSSIGVAEIGANSQPLNP